MSEAVWIKTEPSVDGSTYVVTIEFDDDHATVLTPRTARDYASAVLEYAQRAEYDGAVVTQLRSLGVEDQAIMAVVTDLRSDRPPVEGRGILAPMKIEPGVNPHGKGFLKLDLNGNEGQWEVPEARTHALTVLEAVHAADLDSGYYRALTGLVGLDQGRARQVIADLADHRWDYGDRAEGEQA